MSGPERWVVSACLLGQACRYDGASRAHAGVQAVVDAHLAAGGVVVPVCPEELGGLGTPRPAADLRGGDGAAVWRGEATVQAADDGTDVTRAFVQGADAAATAGGDIDRAILKARSPSCGAGRCWQDGAVRPGDGVFAALLRARGVPLFDEDDPDGSTSDP